MHHAPWCPMHAPCARREARQAPPPRSYVQERSQRRASGRNGGGGGGGAHLRSTPMCSGSRREPKDPAAWSRDYDAIRESLLSGGAGAARGVPTIGGVLNFVGSTFGGSNPRRRLATSESLGERVLGLAWDVLSRWSPAGRASDGATSRLDPAVCALAARRATDAERDEARAAWSAWSSAGDAETGALLCLGITVTHREQDGLPADVSATCAAVAAVCQTLQCTVTAASLAVLREPRLTATPSAALMQRVLLYRRALPTADLTRMCINHPALLALEDEQLAYFTASVSKLRGALPQCDWIDLCCQEDPQLLLCDFDAGLRELTSLWGAHELGTMDAEEAALALRALSGLPRRGVVPGWRRGAPPEPADAGSSRRDN